MNAPIALSVTREDPERLDQFLAVELERVSRSKIKLWCKEQRVFVDGQPRKASFTVSEGMRVELEVPQEGEQQSVEPENIPLDIVFEDPEIVVINKEAGLVVHPGAGVHCGTLVNALAYHFSQLAQRGGSLRPGIVHRLDKGTSGLILVAKTDRAHQFLSEQWQAGAVTKVYQALVWGLPDPPQGEIESHIGRHPKYRHLMAANVEGGRRAFSRYKTVETFPEAAMVNVQILTGRTHQIRVHLAHLGHPVVGDAMYGKGRHRGLAGTFPHMPDHPMLHAAMLRFPHPGGQLLTFKQDPPAAFRECAAHLAKWPY